MSKASVVLTQKKKQQNRKLLRQLECSDQVVYIENSASCQKQNVEVRSDQVDSKFASKNNNGWTLTKENAANFHF